MSITISMWGRDHYSTLLYIEDCNVDNNCRVDNRKMRTYRSGEKNYPTRTRDGNPWHDITHDDWGCVQDFIDAGLVMRPHPLRMVLTDAGWYVAHAVRRARAEKTSQSDAMIKSALAVQS